MFLMPRVAAHDRNIHEAKSWYEKVVKNVVKKEPFNIILCFFSLFEQVWTFFDDINLRLLL